ncbi:MAG: hypothetical protein ABFS86_03600 [Planctomycetota bacterium]
MSRSLRIVAPLLLIAALAIAGGSQVAGSLFAQEEAPVAPAAPAGPETPAGPPTLANLVPEGALAFIRINDLAKLDAEVLELVKIIEPEEVDDASIKANLGKVMSNPDLEGVDLDQPVGIAMFMSAMGPMPIVIMSLSDPAAFSVRTAGNESVKVVGPFAAWARSPGVLEGVKVAEKPSPLFAQLRDGDVSVAVNMEVVGPMIIPMLGQLDMIVEMIRQQAGDAVGDMYAGMVAEMKTAIADTAGLNVAANLRGGKLDVTYRYVPKEGSATAKKIAEAKVTRKSYLGYIDSADFMAIDMKVPGSELWESFASIYGGMFKDPEMLEMVKQSFLLLDGMAVGISFDGGASETFAMGVTNEEEYAKLIDLMPKHFDEMMKSMAEMMPEGQELPFDMGFTQGEPWEYGGVKVRSFSIKMAMKESESPEVPPEAVDAMKKMFAKMLGGETIDYHLAILDGMAVGAVGVGARERTVALIEMVKSGRPGLPPAAVASAMAGFPADAHMKFFMDVSPLLRLISDLPKIPEEAKPLLANAPAGLGLSFYVAKDGAAVDLGYRVDLKLIASYAAKWVQIRK